MVAIMIIGAGNIGSRHLQALARVPQPLAITVIDPSPESLKIAQKRFEEIPQAAPHHIQYQAAIPEAAGAIDIAIIATTSSHRRAALESLPAIHPVRFMILEKILFDRVEDYDEVPVLIARKGIAAWVNCPMRMMPVYRDLRQQFAHKPIRYSVRGDFGLMTIAVHYLDHAAFLTGNTDFTVDISGLDPTPVPAKRTGYWERTGTLTAKGADGSVVEITSRPGIGAAVMTLSSDTFQATLEEQKLSLPLQSEMTTDVVTELLTQGTCQLTPLADSIKIHQALLAPFQEPYLFT